MKKQRKHYTPEEKVAILRRHLVEGVPISDLCDERGLQPSVFYRWQKEYVEHYNNVRLNSAIGYITPKDRLAGHQQEIQAQRDRKLDAAREQRKNRRQRAA